MRPKKNTAETSPYSEKKRSGALSSPFCRKAGWAAGSVAYYCILGYFPPQSGSWEFLEVFSGGGGTAQGHICCRREWQESWKRLRKEWGQARWHRLADVKEKKAASRLTAGEQPLLNVLNEGTGYWDFSCIHLKGRLLWEVGGSLLDLTPTSPARDTCCRMSPWSAGAHVITSEMQH